MGEPATSVGSAPSEPPGDRRAWVEQIMGMPISIHLRGAGLTGSQRPDGAPSSTIEGAVHAAFDALQRELDTEITASLSDARTKLMENFDDDVHRKLKVRNDATRTQLNRYGEWLWELTRIELGDAAAFDTRSDHSVTISGSAARGIAKRLRRHGYVIAADSNSFFVDDTTGPLSDGELDRAQRRCHRLALLTPIGTFAVDGHRRSDHEFAHLRTTRRNRRQQGCRAQRVRRHVSFHRVHRLPHAYFCGFVIDNLNAVEGAFDDGAITNITAQQFHVRWQAAGLPLMHLLDKAIENAHAMTAL